MSIRWTQELPTWEKSGWQTNVAYLFTSKSRRGFRIEICLNSVYTRAAGHIAILMIDIHSHVVWGLDDCATSMEQSLSMLRAAANSGTTHIVATPHSNAEFSYQPELLEERMRQLSACTGGKPRIYRGCDLHLSFNNIDDVLGGRQSIH